MKRYKKAEIIADKFAKGCEKCPYEKNKEENYCDLQDICLMIEVIDGVVEHKVF